MKYLLASYILSKKQQMRALRAMEIETSKRTREYNENRGWYLLASRMSEEMNWELCKELKWSFEQKQRLIDAISEQDICHYDEALSLAEEFLKSL